MSVIGCSQNVKENTPNEPAKPYFLASSETDRWRACQTLLTDGVGSEGKLMAGTAPPCFHWRRKVEHGVKGLGKKTLLVSI
jgi:hypothetical protein